MKKIVILAVVTIIVAVFTVVLIVKSVNPLTVEPEEYASVRFVQIGWERIRLLESDRYYDRFVDMYVDTETRVIYWARTNSQYGSGLTVLVDSDGKPILYEGDFSEIVK